MKETITMEMMINEFNEMKEIGVKECKPIYISHGHQIYLINGIHLTTKGIFFIVEAYPEVIEEVETPLPGSRYNCKLMRTDGTIM